VRKIKALVAHLAEVTGLPHEHIHAYMDKGELLPTGRDLGVIVPDDDGARLRQIEIGVWKYDAVVQIERYAGDGPTLAAVILGWVSDNDGDRDGLLDPEVDAEINDRDTADIEIACEFQERLTLVEDPAGDIPYAGTRWRVDEPEITAAESVSVGYDRAG